MGALYPYGILRVGAGHSQPAEHTANQVKAKPVKQKSHERINDECIRNVN
jgi:hypothetical protein